MAFSFNYSFRQAVREATLTSLLFQLIVGDVEKEEDTSLSTPWALLSTSEIFYRET